MYWGLLAVIPLVLIIPVNAYADNDIGIMCQILAILGLCDIDEVIPFDVNESSFYARIENNKVVDVIVASYSFVIEQPGNWVQTFDDGSKRNYFAGIGYTYNNTKDVFIPPKPATNAILNQTSMKWEIPVIPPMLNGTGDNST